VAWGLWATTSGLTGTLAEADLARIGRYGIKATSTDRGTVLLDAACRHGRADLLALDLDIPTLAAQPTDAVPALLRALAGPSGPVRRAAAAGGGPTDWAQRLGRVSPTERYQTVLNLARTHAAAVLGHADPGVVRADSAFKDLGFDSLTAVELRNRLTAATGLRLPASLVFDYPRVAVLTGHLLERLVPDGELPNGDGEVRGRRDLTNPVLDELARLENTLSAVDVGDLDSAVVTARLEALLTRWKVACPSSDAAGTVARLQVATAEQVLDFIDNELGV